MDKVSKVFDAKIDNLHDVLGFVEEQFESHGASMKVINIMNISVEEMFANVCMYAYAQKNNEGNCTIEVWFEGEDGYVSLTDSGMFFNPLAKDDPNIHASAEERGIGGLGIYMVKEYMDDCTYERHDDMNTFTMKRKIK